ncbi:MAG: flagellar biosynthesis protein FliQ [Fimbriimonadia bacterium]|nr:flagellar biosynthesis protein FliQ [Fimbriimonadia bacterium]
MSQAEALELGRQAMMVALQVSAPILICGMIAGLLVSVFQAVTQIQEMTLSYIPKMVVVAIVLMVAGSWMMTQMVDFMTRVFENLPPR